MNKVYLIHLEFCADCEIHFETRVTLTLEKAKEILKQWAKDEMFNSWISSYGKEDFDEYEFSDDYFTATYGELSTTIWIEEKEIEE